MVQLRALVVCTGNTCRSPMAEGLARTALAERLCCEEPRLAEFGFEVQDIGFKEDTYIEDVETVTDVMAETMVNWGIRQVWGMVGHSNLGLADALDARPGQGRGELPLPATAIELPLDVRFFQRHARGAAVDHHADPFAMGLAEGGDTKQGSETTGHCTSSS